MPEFGDHIPGLKSAVESVNASLLQKNATIQFRDDGNDIQTKGEFEYVDFIGTGVAATDAGGGVLAVTISGGGGGSFHIDGGSASSIYTGDQNLNGGGA